jgi:transposase-like protein
LEKSGQTVRAFARAHGIHPERLARWRRQLREAPVEAVKFHRVRVVKAGERRKETADSERIEVVLNGGQVVRVPRGCRAEDLQVVVAVLEGRSAC